MQERIRFPCKNLQYQLHPLHGECYAISSQTQHKYGIGEITMFTNVGQSVFGDTESTRLRDCCNLLFFVDDLFDEGMIKHLRSSLKLSFSSSYNRI